MDPGRYYPGGEEILGDHGRSLRMLHARQDQPEGWGHHGGPYDVPGIHDRREVG